MLKLEFLDASFVSLAAKEIEVLNASDPMDTYTFHEVSLHAPANTAWARIVLLFEGDANDSGGAALFDDAQLQAPEPASMFALLACTLGWSLQRPGRRNR